MIKKLILAISLFSSVALSDGVCFSPGKCADSLINFIAASKKSVDVAIYSLTYKPISDALIGKHRAGIPVRVIVDKVESTASNSMVSSLVAAGVPVRYGVQVGTGIMHDKFIISDNALLETGSFNYTYSANTLNQENQVYLSNASIVSQFSSHFNAMWAASSTTLKKKPKK